MESVIHALTEKFSISKISDYLVGLIPMLVVAAIILAVFYLGWRFLRTGLRVALSKTNVDRTACQPTGAQDLPWKVLVALAILDSSVKVVPYQAV